MKHSLWLISALLFIVLTPIQLWANEGILRRNSATAVAFRPHSTTLQDISSLSAAVVDPSTGQLMLVGGAGGSAVNLDDFIVALKVIYSGEYPAVSIDPGPNNSVMDVVYFGGIENTHLGFVLYEADRLLKSYSLGVDNLTGQEIASNVPGYQSELALATAGVREFGEPVWHRSWFEPAQLTSPNPAGPGGRKGISLSDLDVILKTEYISIAGSPIPGEGSDPSAEQFVDHFNTNFAAFAAEKPVLQELVQIRRWLYLARWLRDENIPIAAEWLSREVASVETPETTPRISVSRDLGSYRLVLGGGVDFTQQNAYPEQDSFVTSLVDTLLSLPPSERAGTVTLAGQNYTVVILELYQTASYAQVDAAGRIEHRASDDGRLLSIEDPVEGVTNFDEYDESGRLVEKTINLSHQIVTFQPTGTETAQILYPTEATAEQDMPALLSALTGQSSLINEDASSQLHTYEQLQDGGQLYQPEWQTMSIPGGGEATVLPFTVKGEAWAVVSGDLSPITIPESDVVASGTEAGNPLQIVRGVTAVDFFTRATVAQISNENTQFVYRFEADGTSYFQVGQQIVSLPELDEDDVFIEGGDSDLTTVLQPLLEAMTAETIVLFRGSGFPETQAGEAYEAANREFNQRMTQLLISQAGISNVQSDDEAEEAVNNLAAQRPLVNELSEPNLDVILVVNSLTGEANLNEITLIRQAFETMNIPVVTDLRTPLTHDNLMLITGQTDSEIESSVLPQLSDNDNLKDRYLIMFVVNQGVSDRNYTRLAITEYDASGVLVNIEQIDLFAVRTLAEALTESLNEYQGTSPGQAIIEMIQTQLAQPDLDPETRIGLERLLRSLVTLLSQIPDNEGIQ